MTKPSTHLMVLVGLSLVLYAQVLGFGFLNYDDDAYLFNDLVRSWSDASWKDRALTPLLGYPLAVPVALHAAVASLFDYHPAYFHALNLLFHLVNVALLFGVLRTLTQQPWAAALGAAAWAFHPVLAESICWITSLKEVTVTTGVLSVLFALQRFRRSRRRTWLILGGGGVLWTVLAKPTGIVLGPILIVFLGLLHWKEDFAFKRTLGGFAIVASVAAVGIAVVAFSLHQQYGGQRSGFRPDLIVASAAIQIQNYVVPLNFSPLYRFEGVPTEAWVFVPGVAALLLFAAARTRKSAPLVALGILWLIVSWAPTSNLILLARFTATSYAYLPTIGAAFVVAGVVDARWDARPPAKVLAGFVGLCVIGSALAFVESGSWRDSGTLWVKAHRQDPKDEFVTMKLGQAAYESREYELAIKVFEKVPRESYGSRLQVPVRWGLAYCRVGDTQRCVSLLSAAAMSYRGREGVALRREARFTRRVLAQAVRDFKLDINAVPPPLREAVRKASPISLP